MLPSILAKQLQKGIGDYIETTFPMTNEPFKGSVSKMLAQKGSVYHEPFIAVRLPFRVSDRMPTCFKAVQPGFTPYVHQQKAFERLTGDDGRSTLISTGTGSGKTECFLYPILDYCYSHRGERGIKALIIYPMNALATDQAGRIAKLIYDNEKLRGNVSVGMYVGGREHTPARAMSEHSVITDHDTLLDRPPDILMTNYKMLDYLLVRPRDAALWRDNDDETLKYIAVDEFHTFDGAQGTDLACLLRRLKRRLGIYEGYLCCIGTSATMGSGDSTAVILEYAKEVFGEPFDRDAVITEDRLSAREYLSGIPATEFAIPSADETAELDRLIEDDEPEEYLRCAVSAWLPDFSEDVMSDAGRIRLGEELLHHGFVQALNTLTEGAYFQVSKVAEELSVHYPELSSLPDSSSAVNSLYALISHARTGEPGSLRPFLNVQVQLWMRELRRLVAKVDPEDISYEIEGNLNAQQAKQYLPVVNCRDCGITGWVSVLNERGNATVTNLQAFYNMYFRADEQIAMMFPYSHEERIAGMIPARICPDCLQVVTGDEGPKECPACGVRMVDVQCPVNIRKAGSKGSRQYVCPCCGSSRGLSLMGMRSSTEISASLSQMFASRFNDDKKTLAFSDNVQDAAYRAGFFNARTWRFGLRTAIQSYCTESGAGQSLEEFQKGFIGYWHERMTDEQFVSFFIGPNMTWRQSYEDMVENRRLKRDEGARKLMRDVERRVGYEIMLEYGLSGNIGRTLEKSGCSVISFDNSDVERIADAVRERTVNELGILSGEDETAFRRMAAGYLDLMRTGGAFADPAFDEFTLDDGKTYRWTRNKGWWLPGLQSGRNTPRFPAEHIGKGVPVREFDLLTSRKYTDMIAGCCTEVMVDDSNFDMISRFIMEEALKQGLVVRVPSSANYKVYALNKERLFITDEVVKLRCDVCGSIFSVPADNAGFWEGAACRRSGCQGILEAYEPHGIDYYGRLYNNGDLARINAREHTGMMERGDRETLEGDFKREKDSRMLWDPNVLSCTPTLEMGIDIGDLSSVVLCSMPPAQTQFLQRTGRAGRKDGNALTLAVANAVPHDQYFYMDPMDMIGGAVAPPKIFLKASAVLERQFTAFCMDSWVRKGVPDGAIPERVGSILNKLDERPENIFPFNFLSYVQNTLSRQLNTFVQMFAAYLDDNAEEELREFARSSDSDKPSMQLRIIDAFRDLKKQQESLRSSVKDLDGMIKDLENKPKDSSFDDEIRELKNERYALLNIVHEIGNKNVFNFLSDEGLLPNYAFPEAGIILRAVLIRRDDTGISEEGKKYDKMVYEYSRPAASAIGEFAPNNSFYAGGRKLVIDQIDKTTSQSERWRLCPNCSYLCLEEPGKSTAACSRCGSPGWTDSGQVRTMQKVRMVYSNADYKQSLINDETEDRNATFYCRQMLVDVDEDRDIMSAYRMDNRDFPFGYEFVRKATLREINFGESDMVGEKLSVSGVEDVRKGFTVCRYCGKIQPERGRPRHTMFCRTKKMTSVMQEDAYEECLFLYREFTTEVLRLLVPATTMDSPAVRMESFVAAFMLGMKEYFGNVDHLRFTVSEVPVPDADYRKQYLVVYDSVPGGTGYLKQLMHDEDALIEIFEKSLSVMENCSCRDDPQKDGCYHCLYAYRQSRNIGNISRKAAINILRSILSGKDNVEKIARINDIPVNPLFDSELEQRFMEAVRTKAGAANVRDSIRNGKHGYYVKLENAAWEVEPQVLLGPESGVAVPSKPDFVFWPVNAPDHKPVAVFTDGFLYHKDIVADDTVKREAIRRSGNFRVWSLSFNDVRSVFAPQGGYYTETLAAGNMPSGNNMYRNMVKKGRADALEPEKLSSFDLLFKYLGMEDAERVFRAQAYAYALSLLEPKFMNDSTAFRDWDAAVSGVEEQARFSDNEFVFKKTMYGRWIPRKSNAHLTFYAGIAAEKLKKEGPVAVCAVLADEKDLRTDKYEEEWNGFWRFHNLMQFSDEFMAVSSTGMERMDYLALPVMRRDANEGAAPAADAWDAILGLLFDGDAKAFVEFARNAGIPAPAEDDIGYEAEGADGEVIATVEIAWPERKIGFMTTEQAADEGILEKQGWKIITGSDMEGTDLALLFGGE